ncbi:17765_t:CDS:2 [Racocetra fulgida]|uniref:17765_t:CDS:1 n=1 Tax=Racocetra fulgida TaxID=60492 RepID=A0A9N9FES0_9GLOM|nr:17765_t:CDS:2 [Racocetra fulgida]
MNNATNLPQNNTEINISIKIVASNSLDLKDGPFAFNLPREVTLEKIRDNLMRRRDALHMGSNCYFLDKKNNQIPPASESSTKLYEILQTNNNEPILYIIQKTKYDWTQLIMKCEYGFTFDENNKFIKDASESAFKINVNEIQKLDLVNKYFEEEKECNHKLEAFCERNLISGGSVSAKSLWLSISFGLSQECSKQMLSNREEFTKYSHQKWKKAIVILQKSCISLTENFIKAVKDALAMSTDNKKLKSLREISKKYGQFYARSFAFGGAIVKEKTYTNESSKTKKTDLNSKIGLSAQDVAEANVNLNIARRTNNNRKAFNSESIVKIRVVGGIIEKYDSQDNSIKPWSDSLEDHTTWDIIDYDEIGLIFELLDDGLQKQVFDVLAHVDKIKFDVSKLKPFIYPLSSYIEELGEIKIKECKIFASIMGEDKSVFSLHVNYVDDETPEIIVHLIQHKTKKKSLTPKLCWIIVDIITDSSGTITDNSSIISQSNSTPNNSATISESNLTPDNSAIISESNSASNNTVMTKIIKDISSIIIDGFAKLYNDLDHNEISGNSFKKKAIEWLEYFLTPSQGHPNRNFVWGLYRATDCTPYMHSLVYHIPEFIDIHKDLGLMAFSCSALEKKNHIQVCRYFQNTLKDGGHERSRKSAVLEILEHKNRQLFF